MSLCDLVVCETSTHWAVALRAELAGRPPLVREVRSLAACESSLRERSGSLVAIETTASSLDAVISFLHRTAQRFPLAKPVILMSPELTGAESLLREAGAIDVVQSLLELPRLARLGRRQWSQVPPQNQSFNEWVAERLPWPAQATSSA